MSHSVRVKEHSAAPQKHCFPQSLLDDIVRDFPVGVIVELPLEVLTVFLYTKLIFASFRIEEIGLSVQFRS
jgi:hypothetical protein